MPSITNAQAKRAVCWSKDERWTSAYGKLCHAKWLAEDQEAPEVAQLIEDGLDRLVEER